ncbi:ArsJ-associated glyceraldehyde-3-phosphate dehydrogenase [Ferrimonas sp. SCSIO 43195]|uniref:ArsJ-associated glyceraldehyde-3-phosphate dehydrogenase n=1 Tax=Ferrimonas sp. SCSIO 43195 TaxID=2822844 RepID=UPI002075E5B2|nr:ArsJ-associated glyceraldehyde-3-phosphate dehydrogenase [Ferrimonas sp. SCSIO 43195]USD36919.1 ArsJ-associated glyceraldehyde-3-phosphate dehydrogenase [Ferrimonas sp. SCSIO 43195]
MMIRIGINGFGRMGRLTLRTALQRQMPVQIVHVNDPAADAATMAHLLEFDSVHGHWDADIQATDHSITAQGQTFGYSSQRDIDDVDWSGCDLVIEASGKFKTRDQLDRYLAQGVKRVVVTAPVKDASVLNVVVGVNDQLFDPQAHPIVTAASCTTNCLAPVVKVIHQQLGIERGSITTIHDITNTQSILDQPHQDLRRARASGQSLIPTTTGSAKAITQIFPELTGKLNGHAIRVPLANASITDCVFEVARDTDADEVNALLKQAADGELAGVLGFETRPLVSVDYKTDARSSIVDAPSTMVVDKRMVKIYAWYDNEWGYVNRTIELAVKVGQA